MPLETANAESLFTAIDQNFTPDGALCYANLVGLGSDGANVMLGTDIQSWVGVPGGQLCSKIFSKKVQYLLCSTFVPIMLKLFFNYAHQNIHNNSNFAMISVITIINIIN